MNVKNKLLYALANAGNEYISGAALAAQLGVSRNAVWKAVKALNAEGYGIESAPSRGYRLTSDNNRLAAEFITPFLRTNALGRVMSVYSEIDSTNSRAKELASEGASTVRLLSRICSRRPRQTPAERLSRRQEKDFT